MVYKCLGFRKSSWQHMGKKEISFICFLPAALLSISRTEQKMFSLCPIMSSQAISTLSLNTYMENNSRKHQEGPTAEAANWAVRHCHTKCFIKTFAPSACWICRNACWTEIFGFICTMASLTDVRKNRHEAQWLLMKTVLQEFLIVI